MNKNTWIYIVILFGFTLMGCQKKEIPFVCGSIVTLEGRDYCTVQIGAQCWFQENLSTTHYADGTPLVDGTGVGPIFGDYTTPYWFNYEDSAYNSLTYGKLYTWAAVMHGSESCNSNPSGVQGICPGGWHVPSDSEWMQLEMFLGMSSEEANKVMEWRGTDEGGKMKEPGTTHWLTPNVGATNESGFTALPGGVRNEEGLFMAKKYQGYWWSSTEYPGTTASAFRCINYDIPMIWRNFEFKNSAFSVRCLKD
ncbi:MAG: fibrobacter succinogenes major paralogous domain-containing protein [bacterium]